MEFDREENKNVEITSLESRITAGPISDIISPKFVQREGFMTIYEEFKKIDSGECLSWLRFLLDDSSYYDEIAEIITKGNNHCHGSLSGLNRSLKKEGLYIAYFKLVLPPYKNPYGSFVYGSGDLYVDKDISVDENRVFNEVSISGV